MLLKFGTIRYSKVSSKLSSSVWRDNHRDSAAIHVLGSATCSSQRDFRRLHSDNLEVIVYML